MKLLMPLLDVALASYVIVQFFRPEGAFDAVFVIVASIVLVKALRRIWSEVRPDAG